MSRIDRMRRVAALEGMRSLGTEVHERGSAALQWLLDQTEAKFPDDAHRLRQILESRPRNGQALAVALLDLSDAAGLTEEFFARARRS